MRKADVAVESHSMYNLQENYFELLGIEQEFTIDQNKLQQNYIKLQQLFHPDKLIHKANAENILAMEYSAKLNHIYQILKDDKKRAEYLLSLHNIIINTDHDNVKPDLVMLDEIFELNTHKETESIKKEQQICWEVFNNNYPNNLQKAAQAIIKLQYLSKI